MKQLTSMNYEKISIETKTPFRFELQKPYPHETPFSGLLYEVGGETITTFTILKLSKNDSPNPFVSLERKEVFLNFEGIDDSSGLKVIGTIRSENNTNYGGTMYYFSFHEFYLN